MIISVAWFNGHSLNSILSSCRRKRICLECQASILFVLPRQICKEELLQRVPDGLGLKLRFRAMMIGCRKIYHDSQPRYLSLYIGTYNPTLTSKFL